MFIIGAIERVIKAKYSYNNKATKIELIVNNENNKYKLFNIDKQMMNRQQQMKKSSIQRDLSIYNKVIKK